MTSFKVNLIFILILLQSFLANADTINSNVKVHDAGGVGISSTGSSLNVNVTNQAGTGTTTVISGGVAITSPNPLPVSGAFFQTTQPVSATVLPLPVGAATSPLQISGNTTLTNILSQSQAGTAVTSSVLPGGAASAPNQVTSNNILANLLLQLQAGTAITSPNPLPVSLSTFPLPTGASTLGAQTTGNSLLTSLISQLAGGVALTSPNPLPVSIAGGVSVTGPISISGGVAITSPNPLPVSGAFFQSVQPVSATALPLAPNASTAAGQAALLTQLSGGVAITSPNPLPVSAGSLPLPTGAATLAAQTLLLNQLSGGIAITSPNPLPVSGTLTLNGGATSVTNLQQTTISGGVAITSNPPPSDFTVSGSLTTICTTPTGSCPAGSFVSVATHGISSARFQTSGTFTTPSINAQCTLDGTTWFNLRAAGVSNASYSGTALVPVSGLTGQFRVFRQSTCQQLRIVALTLGSGTISVFLSVSEPPDVVEAVPAGRSAVATARNNYATTNVTTSAYVTLVTSTPTSVTKINVFDSSGRTLYLSYALTCGALASSVNTVLIPPGGQGDMDLAIPSGYCVGIEALSANATAGEIDVTFLQ